MATYYDRYASFVANGNMKPLPGIILPKNDSDKQFIYKQGQTRLDKVSQKYYNNPYSGWLILLANPEFGGLEFNIPDLTSIRVPFPFETAINEYIIEINKHKKLYGE